MTTPYDETELLLHLLRIFKTIWNHFKITYNNLSFTLITAFAYYRNIDPMDPLKQYGNFLLNILYYIISPDDGLWSGPKHIVNMKECMK
jgi:hypothetical protein